MAQRLRRDNGQVFIDMANYLEQNIPTSSTSSPVQMTWNGLAGEELVDALVQTQRPISLRKYLKNAGNDYEAGLQIYLAAQRGAMHTAKRKLLEKDYQFEIVNELVILYQWMAQTKRRWTLDQLMLELIRLTHNGRAEQNTFRIQRKDPRRRPSDLLTKYLIHRPPQKRNPQRGDDGRNQNQHQRAMCIR